MFCCGYMLDPDGRIVGRNPIEPFEDKHYKGLHYVGHLDMLWLDWT